MSFSHKYYFFVIAFVFLTVSPVFSAQKSSLLILSQAGSLKNKGDVLSAVYEYCRALLIDSTNQQAADSLKNMVQEASGLSAAERLKLLQITSLLDENRDLQKKINYFNFKVDEIKRQHALNEFTVKEFIFPPKDPLSPSISNEEMLTVFLDDLQSENIELMAQFINLQDAFEKITQEARHNENRLVAHYKERKPAVIKAIDVENLHQELALREAAIENLSQKLVALSLELAEKEKQLAQNEQGLVSSNETLKDVESRFRLGQKIIEEKDQEIVKLKSDLDQANLSLAKYRDYFAKNQSSFETAHIKQLSGMLTIYQSKLKDFYEANKKKDQSIKLLEERLLYVRGVIDQKHQQLELTFENLKKFEAKLQKMESQIVQQGPNNFPTSESDLTALNQWLKKTQGFLAQQYDDFTYLEEYISGSY